MSGLDERPYPRRSTASTRKPSRVSASIVGSNAAAKKFIPWKSTTVWPFGAPTGATSIYAIR
jgi:hypothetical protein